MDVLSSRRFAIRGFCDPLRQVHRREDPAAAVHGRGEAERPAAAEGKTDSKLSPARASWVFPWFPFNANKKGVPDAPVLVFRCCRLSAGIRVRPI